jgi:D-arabinose 1-dehydrogenase-like Zn-dependent alcohol dehydrogenase
MYMDMLSPLGVYVIVGLGSEHATIPTRRMVTSEISIKTVLYSSYRELEALVDLARRGLINYRDLVERVRLEEINEAMERLARGEAMYRQVIVF